MDGDDVVFGPSTRTTNIDNMALLTIATLGFSTNANRSVNALDIAQTKAQSGAPVTAANFRTDVNVNGSINAADIGPVKARSGTSLP